MQTHQGMSMLRVLSLGRFITGRYGSLPFGAYAKPLFRSHAIFTITIESMDTGPDGKQRVRVGHLHLVDLAGSERQVSLAYYTV